LAEFEGLAVSRAAALEFLKALDMKIDRLVGIEPSILHTLEQAVDEGLTQLRFLFDGAVGGF
jgi:hypothetical protein